MTKLIPFSFKEQEIRVAIKNGEVWAVAKDVLLALEYAESTLSSITQKIEHVPHEWRGRHQISTPGGAQSLLCLSEQGLYFFLGRSDKPKALPFQKWLAGEVVPSIRKTGSYSLHSDPSWLAARTDGKQSRRLETDVIAEFIEYAKSQGSQNAPRYYMAITKGVYGALFILEQGGKWQGLRGRLSTIQLTHLSTAEWVAQKYIAEGMALHMHYKDIYRYAIAKVEEIVRILGKALPASIHKLSP